MIVNAITTFTNIIFSAITASIGNLNAGENEQKKYEIFKIINFSSGILFGFLSVCLLLLFDDFITIWLGKEFIMDKLTIFAIVCNFYLIGRLHPITTYRDTLGMFRKTRYIFCLTAIINILLSIVLGNIWGVFGIIIATAIARILTNRWYEPWILYKDYFKVSVKEYWKDSLYYVVCSIINYGISYWICHNIQVDSLLDFIIKLFVCCSINMILFTIEFFHAKESKVLLQKIKRNRIKKVYE